ncbi:MAG: glycoside hydrolase family 2 protein [Bacteroidetes bacterium]|nr:glycoside hydrolase family 2 protein [Bacteroidota bacterium]
MLWSVSARKAVFIVGLFGVWGMEMASAQELRWPAVTSQARPWTRWWWMGSAVDRKNLTWNLEEYKAAGLGGMELTPIYGVKGYEGRFIDYLSPAWMDMFGYTLSEAKRLGLGLDMSTGTGWPFGGGPLIDSSYACREIFYKIFVVHSGGRLGDTVRYWQEPMVHTDGRRVGVDQLVEPVFANRDLQGLALFQVRWGRWLPVAALVGYGPRGEVVDLTGKVGADGRLDWSAPSGGDWTLYGLFQGWHGKMVERAAPGAEGNVIDHFSAVALKKYLSRFDTAMAGRDIAPLRCFFNDSYEVDDARGEGNWTPEFLDKFRRLRGYDLREHLGALVGAGRGGGSVGGSGSGGSAFGGSASGGGAFGDEVSRVLCDYRETVSDLLLEEFTVPWAKWARGKGKLIRNQAHGAPANILDLYAASDIPETEGADVFRYKMATSAAHVSGKGLVSAEAVTWLDEHFLSSYSDVKKAVDEYFLGGVNHIFYHGTAYTPKEDVWPGWLFYASVHFTPNDPAWGSVRVLNDYVARCQSFLQGAKADNEVLLYYPIYDSWSEVEDSATRSGGSGDFGKSLLKHYDKMDPEFSGTGFKECAEWLWKAGYGFDYVSDKQLRGIEAGGRYKTVVVPGCRYLSVEAIERLVRLSMAGVKVVFYKRLPDGAPGLSKLKEREGRFREALGKGHFSAVGDLGAALKGVSREVMVDDSLEFVRNVYGDGHLYFIVNRGTKVFKGEVKLGVRDGVAAIFDPMTGESGMMKGRYLELLPGQSCLVRTWKVGAAAAGSVGAGAVAGSVGSGGPVFPYYRGVGNAVPVEGEWKVEFVSGGPVLPGSVKSSKLESWVGMGMKEFSGTAEYTIGFGRPGGEGGSVGRVERWILDLGKVGRVAEVFLNGKKVGDLIGPEYKVVLKADDLKDRNELKVRVSSGMLNRIEDMERKGVVWKKFYNTNFPAHERATRGADGLFDPTKLPLEEAGLLGPVVLEPVMIMR